MVDKVLFSSDVVEWGTPYDLFYRLNTLYHFDLDPCTTEDNPLQTSVYYTKETNGLKSSWNINRVRNVFVNPPYNEIEKWLEKALFELAENDIKETTIKNIVFLLPARTDTKWFHKYIYTNPIAKIHFLRGRLKFRDAKNSAPFPSMIVTFSKKQ